MQGVETNLKTFCDMRDGKYEPQAAFLRMKQEIENNNPQMWDLAAYRIPKDLTPRLSDWRYLGNIAHLRLYTRSMR